jgi:hypothetical protein
MHLFILHVPFRSFPFRYPNGSVEWVQLSHHRTSEGFLSGEENPRWGFGSLDVLTLATIDPLSGRVAGWLDFGALLAVPFSLRASPTVSQTRSSGRIFFIRVDENGPVTPPDSRFRPD